MAFSAMFVVICGARLLAALYAPIQDCDEVYNYWEPAHFISHGWGLQTWEWSPEFAIRSWAYVLPHAAAAALVNVLTAGRLNAFWVIRAVFAVFCAWTEYRLAKVLTRKFGATTAWTYVLFTASASGMFHASVSFLPSSFAMYSTTLALAQFLNSNSLDIRQIMTFIAIGGLFGWPFALAIGLPWAIYYTLAQRNMRTWLIEVCKSGMITLIVLGVVLLVDSLVYRKWVMVPFNIVAYNVFNASEESGPAIFGTEPVSYYLVNLILNFNIAFPLALLAFVALLFSKAYRATAAALSPLVLWVGWFSSIPHKEERFMYIIYPFIPFGAAVILPRIWSTLRLPRILLWSCLLTYVLVSTARNAALAVYYGAPFAVYTGIPENSTVCVGREWYRYPSSYFLSKDTHLEFIPSGFNGLLPSTEFVFPPSIPEGMNQYNLHDESKLLDDWKNQCDYIVELGIPVNPEAGEIDPAAAGWEQDICVPFLDTERSSGLSRLLYFGVDETPLGKAQWAQYCRYKRPF